MFRQNNRDINSNNLNVRETGTNYDHSMRNLEVFGNNNSNPYDDRIFLTERELTSYSSSRSERYLPESSNTEFLNQRNLGEITGTLMDADESEYRMPMRSTEDLKMFSRTEKENPQLDFDIYDRDTMNTDFNVKYNDSGNDNFSSLEFNSRLVNNDKINDSLALKLNKFSVYVYKSLKKRTRNDICFSPSNLLNVLLVLMCSSSDYVYNVIQSIIGESTASDVIKLLEKIKLHKDFNILYLPKHAQINETYKILVHKIIDIHNYKNNTYEYKYINSLISNNTNNVINNIISPDKLDGKILSVNCSYVRSKWECFKCNINTLPFKGKYRKFMIGENTRQGYYKNDKVRLIEMEQKDGSIIGFYQGNIENLIESINKTVLTNFIFLAIPIFKKHSKYNFKTILDALGIDIFNETNFINLTSEPIQIGNIIQEVRVDIIPSETEHIKSRGNGVRVLLDSDFICYIKKYGVITHLFEMS